MGIVVEVIDAIGVEKACTPHQAVDFIALREQELGKIGAVLSGDTGDQCALRHGSEATLLRSLRHSGTPAPRGFAARSRSRATKISADEGLPFDSDERSHG